MKHWTTTINGIELRARFTHVLDPIDVAGVVLDARQAGQVSDGRYKGVTGVTICALRDSAGVTVARGYALCGTGKTDKPAQYSKKLGRTISFGRAEKAARRLL